MMHLVGAEARQLSRLAGLRTFNSKPSTLNRLMAGTAFVDQLKAKFGDKIAGANLENIDPWIEVTPDGLLDVCRYLRDEPTLAFDLSELHLGRRLSAHGREEGGQSGMAAAHGSRLSPVQHEAQTQPRAEGDSAALEKRQAGRIARAAERFRICGARPIGTSAKCTTCPACTSPAIRICAASSAPKTGSATRFAKTTRCRSNTTGFEGGR